ncbi:hypothetical protein ScPMuIL_016691 [Solemya velum]
MREFDLPSLSILLLLVATSESRLCQKTNDGHPYDFVVGILSAGNGQSPLQAWIEDYISAKSPMVQDCFGNPSFVVLDVQETLQLQEHGWSRITAGMQNAVAIQAQHKHKGGVSVVVGPFYMNLAAVLEFRGIPYIVTDYEGFDWIDISKVRDPVKWKTTIEVRPPVQELNLAVVDLFKVQKWTNALVIMPEEPRKNQECQDLTEQMIVNGISPIPYSLTVKNMNTKQIKKQIDKVLRNARMLEQKIVVICSPDEEKQNLIEAVLFEAKMFNMLGEQDHAFIIVDPTLYNKPLEDINMYRTGLFVAKAQLLAFRFRSPLGTQVSGADEASAIDAANIIKKAQKKYLEQQGAVKSDEFSRERFLESLKEVNLPSGKTGEILFNSTGQRVNYTLHLYNHGGLHKRKVGTWSPGPGSTTDRLVSNQDLGEEEEVGEGLFPDIVKVVVVKEDPFVMIRRAVRGHEYHGNDRFEGFSVDLLKRLAELLQFKYEIYVSPNNRYGAQDSDGRWDGIVGEVLAENATLGMGAISITSEREKVIDFSLGVMSTGVNLLISKPEEMFSIFQFMQPFSLELWFSIVGAAIIVSGAYYILDYFNNERQFTVRSTLWFSVGTIFVRGTDFSPKPLSQRILSTGFMFFSLITVSTYTANMAAFLTTTNLEESVASIEDLAKSNMGCGTVKNSATMNFLQVGNKEIYRKLWRKLQQSNGLVKNFTEGRKRVEAGNFAFIFDYSINEYSEKKFCKTKSVASPILLQEHGIAIQAGAAFKIRLNIALLKLKELRLIQELKKKWWDDKRECDTDGESKNSQQVEFDIKHTAGVFIVGAIGLVCAFSIFFTKKLFYRLLKKRRAKKAKAKERSNEDLLERKEKSIW